MRIWFSISSVVTLCFAQCPAEECPSDETVLLQTGFKQRGSVLATQSDAVQKARSSPPIEAWVGHQCCHVDDSSCDQSVDLGGYHSLSECQNGCEGLSGCIGFEFGNDLDDENNRCSSVDHLQCKCWLVVGACDSQGEHPGYDVYLLDYFAPTPPAMSQILVGHECCDHEHCDQSVAVDGYPSFSECWDECTGHPGCKGFEFGNYFNNGYSRCSSVGNCKCWLVTGECNEPRAHRGYNAYLLGNVPAPPAGTYDDCRAGLDDDCEFDAGAGISSWFTEEKFHEMFPNIRNTADGCQAGQVLTYKCLIRATLEFPLFASSGDEHDKKRELAAWFGIMGQETTGGGCRASVETILAANNDGVISSNPDRYEGATDAWECSCSESHIGQLECEEYDENDELVSNTCSEWGLCKVLESSGGYCCTEEDPPCPNNPYPCVDDQDYNGRGPMQLSWNYNYGQFSRDFCGDKNTLLNNPGWVASSPRLAWASALWFWFTGGACIEDETCKPSPHEVFTGIREAETDAGRIPGLGWAINVVNGGLECGGAGVGRCDYRVHSRVRFYKHFCKSELLDVSPLKATWTDDNLFCSEQQNYKPAPSASSCSDCLAESPPQTCFVAEWGASCFSPGQGKVGCEGQGGEWCGGGS